MATMNEWSPEAAKAEAINRGNAHAHANIRRTWNEDDYRYAWYQYHKLLNTTEYTFRRAYDFFVEAHEVR